MYAPFLLQNMNPSDEHINCCKGFFDLGASSVPLYESKFHFTATFLLIDLVVFQPSSNLLTYFLPTQSNCIEINIKTQWSILVLTGTLSINSAVVVEFTIELNTSSASP